MTLSAAYSRLPARGVALMRRHAIGSLLAASLHASTAEARDDARVRLLRLPGGREAYVRAVLAAAPEWRQRRHVVRGLVGEELAAAREADARAVARVARWRGAHGRA